MRITTVSGESFQSTDRAKILEALGNMDNLGEVFFEDVEVQRIKDSYFNIYKDIFAEYSVGLDYLSTERPLTKEQMACFFVVLFASSDFYLTGYRLEYGRGNFCYGAVDLPCENGLVKIQDLADAIKKMTELHPTCEIQNLSVVCYR